MTQKRTWTVTVGMFSSRNNTLATRDQVDRLRDELQVVGAVAQHHLGKEARLGTPNIVHYYMTVYDPLSLGPP